jgi:hypothetical protein
MLQMFVFALDCKFGNGQFVVISDSYTDAVEILHEQLGEQTSVYPGRDSCEAGHQKYEYGYFLVATKPIVSGTFAHCKYVDE